MGDTTTLNSVTNQEFLSESVFDQVDSIYLLKTTFRAPTYHLVLDGRIKFIQRVKFIKDDLYLLKFVLQDHTDQIWVCLWENSTTYPIHLSSIPKNIFVKLSNCSLQFNDHHQTLQLSLYSYDDIEFL